MASGNDTPTDNMRASILDRLPAELLLHIVNHVATDISALCSLARTCRLFQVECERHIYKTIDLSLLANVSHLVKAFARLPNRLAYIERLLGVYRFDPITKTRANSTSPAHQILNFYINKMKSLKEWYIESPFDNFAWDSDEGREWVEKDMKQYQTALSAASWAKSDIVAVQQSFDLRRAGLICQHDIGLSKLEKLTIHSHGISSDFWELGDFKCLFHHPSLRYIHISCVALPVDLPELESFARLTPLTTLIFDECEIEPKALRRILKTPKALKSLTLGENNYNISDKRPLNPRLSKSPHASLDALREVSHSLEELTHRDPSWIFEQPFPSWYFDSGEGMRNFHHLRFLDVDPCSFLHRIVQLLQLAPPNLETLRLHYGHIPSLDDLAEFPLDLYPDFGPYTSLSKLKTIEMIAVAGPEPYNARPEFLCEESRLRERHKYAYKLHAYGINLKVCLEAIWTSGHIPPYLNGEPKPKAVCIYDAAAIGFRRRIFDMDDTAATTSPKLTSPFEGESNTSTEPAETDQLNDTDIRAICNELKRRLTRVWDDMDPADSDTRMSDSSGFNEYGEEDDEHGEFDEDEDIDDDDDEEDLDDDDADVDADLLDDDVMELADYLYWADSSGTSFDEMEDGADIHHALENTSEDISTHAGLRAAVEAHIARRRAEGDAEFGSDLPNMDGPQFRQWAEEIRLSQAMASSSKSKS